MEKKIKTTEIISWIIVVILCIGYFRALIVERISDNIVRKHIMMKNNQMNKSY